MYIYVGGVPGVGKSSILSATVALASDNKVIKVEGSSLMCQMAGVSSVAELRAIPEDTRRLLRSRMIDHLYRLDSDDPETVRIGDGHFCYFDMSGESFGVRPISPRDRAQLRSFVLFTAGPKQIKMRRMKDRDSRPDRQFDLKFIRLELMLERTVAQIQAHVLNKRLLIFDTTRTSVVTLSRRFWSYIEEVRSERIE